MRVFLRSGPPPAEPPLGGMSRQPVRMHVRRLRAEARAIMQSGFKPRDAYQWSKYPKNPQIISLDAPSSTQPPQRTASNVLTSQSALTSNGVHPPTAPGSHAPSHAAAHGVLPHVVVGTHMMRGNTAVSQPM
jgi:hypothetical protein